MNHTDVKLLTSREWLVSNGLGGFASSTIVGQNTRRYHGLLTASLVPPTQRMVTVSKVEEKVYTGSKELALSTNQYPDVTHPQGYQYLDSFERFPLPKMNFRLNPGFLSKTIFMVYGQNTTVVEYHNDSDRKIQLALNPLYTYRDYHSLLRKNDYFDFYYELQKEGKLKIYPHYGSQPIYCYFNKGVFEEARNWYFNMEFARESDRGLDNQEDVYSLGKITVTLEAQEKIFLIFSMEDISGLAKNPEALKEVELKRQAEIIAPYPAHAFLRDLILSGEQFIVHRASTKSDSILAGYPWFSDWGRDTMIALRGLCLSLHKPEQVRSILKTFLKYTNQGMFPNRFPDYEGEVIGYNTMDATLWLFVVLYEYVQAFGEDEFIKSNMGIFEEIIQHHLKGTRYDIQATPEGFLYGGDEKTQLTWMDARIGNYTVTPRWGCPIEINALWYNALKTFQFLCNRLGQKVPTEIVQVSNNFEKHFKTHFWNPDGYLYDVIIPSKRSDASIRPNQIYALSLPFSVLNEAEEKQVLEVVTEYLYTDFGLRTLSQNHADFKPMYQGSPWDRDTAYHQGTVWPFLIGEYWIAYLKVHKYSEEAKRSVLEGLEALKKHFYENEAIGGISEIFDGALPERGKGTIHQAWSVSNLIKLFMDYQLYELAD